MLYLHVHKWIQSALDNVTMRKQNSMNGKQESISGYFG